MKALIHDLRTSKRLNGKWRAHRFSNETLKSWEGRMIGFQCGKSMMSCENIRKEVLKMKGG